eukprot:TRINITY_DN73827_c0_g1_i1.p1 TRINITY_DN73827_c0_g1~~TRINITY_DN73827_c0_g1_i1.p1  ORF type:complete len:871 (+),score=182.54 TRINITY_DN73827_c0_g1_i1:61-2673(+)
MAENETEPETLGDPIGDTPHYSVHVTPIAGGTERAPDEGYYVNMGKTVPLEKLQERIGEKLGVAASKVMIVYEARVLEASKDLAANTVVLPGPAARRRGVKLALNFDLTVDQTMKEHAEMEEAARAEEEAKIRAALEEQTRLREERERLQKEEAQRLQERLEQERQRAAELAAAAEAAGLRPPPAAGAVMPKLAFRRLCEELRRVQRGVAKGELPWLLRCEPTDDNLMCWEVDMTFNEESPLQQSLNKLATDTFDDTKNRLTMQVRFPPEYPASPPEVWIQKPRLKFEKGVGVTFGGKACSPMLIASNWQNGISMQVILDELRAKLTESGAEVDIRVSKKQDYPTAPPMLARLATSRFEGANDFEVPHMIAISGVQAAAFLGDQTRLEQSDKIALPFEFADRIYGRAAHGQEVDFPLIFEVKTRLGRKAHCAIFEFVAGLPSDHCMLPQWVMDDLFIEERDPVRIRGVKLPLCTYVKIQPHTLEFYDAVQEAGGNVQALLLASIKRFSALTVETAIPIDINGRAFSVQILDLKPAGAVRVIDTDVTREFEFPVEFVAAPDLDDEATRLERQKEMIERFHAQQAEQEAAKRSHEGKREEILAKHFEAARDRAVAAAGADTGAEGDIEVMLRLPKGQLKCKFREGAPVTAMVAMVLQSDWAKSAKPWGVKLIVNFPKRELLANETISKDMHRGAISVVEVGAPEDEQKLFEAAGKEGVLVDSDAPAAGGENELPPLDEEALERQTRRAFEVQCFIQAGDSPEEALRRVEAGEQAPSIDAMNAPARPPPVPAARAPAPDRQRLDPAAIVQEAFDGPPLGQEHLARPPEPDDPHYQEITTVMTVTGCTPWGARQILEARAWNVEQAVNDLLEMH